MTHTPIAIIGAGVAGLAAARQLSPTSYVIFEKSRGPGGRLASKRINGLRADIGAQFFTVRDPRFEETIALASDAGAVRRWSPRMGAFQNGRPVSSPDKQRRYVGFPYMNSLGHFLAQSVDVRREARISSVKRDGAAFVLTSTAGEIYTAEQVLVTAPVDQTTPQQRLETSSEVRHILEARESSHVQPRHHPRLKCFLFRMICAFDYYSNLDVAEYSRVARVYTEYAYPVL